MDIKKKKKKAKHAMPWLFDATSHKLFEYVFLGIPVLCGSIYTIAPQKDIRVFTSNELRDRKLFEYWIRNSLDAIMHMNYGSATFSSPLWTQWIGYPQAGSPIHWMV